MADGERPPLRRYTGGCHCGAVRYEVEAPEILQVVECNCSICLKKQNHHFIVPVKQFTLLQGEERLTTYTFNTHAAKHCFCKLCGVQSFYRPRSNPDGVGIMPHCLDDQATLTFADRLHFDGSDWEATMETRGNELKAMSASGPS